MRQSAEAHVRFGPDGLVPVVAQDVVTGDVLMVASMNAEALRLTQSTGEAHYWSRSRNTLWRKGATSGHTQFVAEIRINCERNTLLLLVRQNGAVCHDGYPTCYYRRLDHSELTVVRERSFDPAAVHGPEVHDSVSETIADFDQLVESTRRQYGAYAYLRDHDLSAVSATSRRLRSPEVDVAPRVSDEMRELAGVLDGQHRHGDFLHDLRLEASQVIYWILIQSLRTGATWLQLRPDRALTVEDLDPEPSAAARLLRAEAQRWKAGEDDDDLSSKAHAALGLVALACRSGGLDPRSAIDADLAELRSRPYLAPYFAHEDATGERPTPPSTPSST